MLTILAILAVKNLKQHALHIQPSFYCNSHFVKTQEINKRMQDVSTATAQRWLTCCARQFKSGDVTPLIPGIASNLFFLFWTALVQINLKVYDLFDVF